MLSVILNSITRPEELVALYQYKFAPKTDAQIRLQQTLAKDASKKRCYDFLNMTSRSFAAVIQELEPDEVRDAICLFYLVLRGLDTIEDDMTLPLDRKVELLRSFDKIIYKKGWTFNESGPNEKDRELLVQFDVVIDEFLRLKPQYQSVIENITKLMGNGMADYATGEHRENTSVATVKDFDLYCHYVAGLVGYGLSDIFSASGYELKELAEEKKISNSMGLFLQKTNIIRDYREDLDDGRQFWPKEIWGKYAEEFSEFTKAENQLKAKYCLNDMVLNVLNHVPDVLTYLSKLQTRPIFMFCAIPQVMAIATLALVFNNLDIYQRNIKIRKGEAVKLILECTSMDNVIAVFRKYVFEIAKKNEACDPNFMEISMAIGRV
ncbi:farnesyl-diphosphate farnesyltransferase [Rhizopus delemar RA 99-880]|uniref:Squalene synthase n=1 Tax=Rhizopus delemar (strain RA 99-880 / ATCC MYA-4621 / FGSC 9543 / NRRL 43880) TaxID=246409 RepID=I1BW59_RHIO9|nr:farnesyl-diphosphate farnesyltransferase [Rhizopus delemar RA 99-880]|eukprot:EIE80439.1 farnesyl-diphosphate farnesyltransferase [Rhizopus delemar RA 99-880]